MIKIFTGEDRVKAQKEIVNFLGEEYEVVEGSDLTIGDLPSLFFGASLFAVERRILIRDLNDNKAVFEKLIDYVETSHRVVLLETKLDKRTSAYKALKSKVEVMEFSLSKNLELNLVFDIYKVAKKDGQRALEMLDKVQQGEDPIMFTGLMISQALKDYKMHPGAKEKRALVELSKLDLDLKSTTMQPWLLVRSFLLQLA